jgi:hypothetical protein
MNPPETRTSAPIGHGPGGASLPEPSQPRIELLEVSCAELDLEHLHGFSLHLPKPGMADVGRMGTTYALHFEGWAVGRHLPVIRLDLNQDNLLARRIPLNVRRPDLKERYPDAPDAELNGFSMSVNALKFLRNFEISVEVVFSDESSVKVATLRGRRAKLRSNFDAQLQPLMITTLGRSGSTALISLLASHPQIVAYRPSETESRVASYWMDLFLGISEPSSYLRQIFPVRLAPGWWTGGASPSPKLDEDPSTREWLGASAVEELAALCQSRIEAFYREIGARADRPNAIYFTEKCQPSAGNALPALLDEIYPASREVVLVRDFRDMMASMSTYSEGSAFGPAPGVALEEHVRRWGISALNLAQNWRRRSDQAHLVRYEDLVLEPSETIERLLVYLGLDASSSAVETFTNTLLDSEAKLESHRTTSSPKESIGRWRKLDIGRQTMYEEAFAPALEAFGYR